MERRTEKQTYAIVKAWLERWRGSEFDAITAMQGINRDWGVSIDWHVAANVLSEMESYGAADRTGFGPDGHVTYIINIKPRLRP